MKLVAKHYIKTPQGTITPGEIFDGETLDKEALKRLKRLQAVEEVTFLSAAEAPEGTDNVTEQPEGGDPSGGEPEDEEPGRDDEEDEPEDEERDIDASEGLVTASGPQKPADKSVARKTGRKAK